MNKRAKSNERKSLQELTIKDNFMFGAVMLNPEICRETLERILGIKIARVEVSKEKRARYYHGQIDMEVLLSGVSYPNLPDTYVIFICDFDPLGQKKYRYTQKKICREDPQLSMDDGAHTIFLSTVGTNEDDVSPDLVRFLKYVGTPLSDSEKDFDDAFIQRVQTAVKEVKASREMGARYMTFQELLNDEREAGRKEGLAEGHATGLEEGRIESLKNLVKKKLEKGKSVEAIAEDLEEDITVIRELMEQL